jgi:PLP dependent protein
MGAMNAERIAENIARIRAQIPPDVQILAAAKGHGPRAIMEAIRAGVALVGENYVQEAQQAHKAIGRLANWHLIGHLQKNKVRKAVAIFDLIETVDSLALAERIDEECGRTGREMPVLIEVNSAREEQKSGVAPDEVERLIRGIVPLSRLRVEGLMTMGPLVGDPDALRPAFAETRRLFERLGRLRLPRVRMRILSMGMSASYSVAIEEGATLVRIGTAIFGERDDD